MIKPHKGGRTANLPNVRITPKVKALIKRQCESEGISVADWVARAALTRLGSRAEIDSMAMRFGFDSIDVDEIEMDCVRRDVALITPDDWRIQFELASATKVFDKQIGVR